MHQLHADEYKSRLTSAITRVAQSGYHLITANCCLSNVDQSVHVSLKMCIIFLAPPVFVKWAGMIGLGRKSRDWLFHLLVAMEWVGFDMGKQADT
jgi:hypothetical protein